jgi:hypothetical protein
MLKPLADDVWTIDLELRSPGTHLPVRTTILRLPDDALLVYAPFDLDDAMAQEIDALGRVAWLVGPNTYHHLRLRHWLQRWPDAELWSAAALQTKRSDLSFTGVLGEGEAPREWEGVVDHVVLGGAPKLGEVVLFHRPSGTALVCDLVFNVVEPRGFFLRLFMRMTGVFRRFAMSRVWKLLTKDRARMRDDVERILGWDIRRVAMAHGDVLEENARARLADALAWMRGGSGRAALPASSVR